MNSTPWCLHTSAVMLMPHKSSPMKACISNTSGFCIWCCLILNHLQLNSNWTHHLPLPKYTHPPVFVIRAAPRSLFNNWTHLFFHRETEDIREKPLSWLLPNQQTCLHRYHPHLSLPGGFSPPLMSLWSYQCPLFSTFSGADTIVHSFYLWRVTLWDSPHWHLNLIWKNKQKN